ncbi:stage V sporulation protein T [Anaerosalibacter bizertensis]|uniref:Stage V sporulation protein T n=1 Tax=Anaerosalibacter bizertensis TaxID=932217 RepID=A0A844FJI4_9FIRM|nr:stage V sporulation protein T [Anaerosalibacter bizertensis]MBV1817034.1 stage V sporulation protein T [Bacteroidales bacterium MSK.15.36]HHV26525.1 stage V sporulation protein T [Tissierellia bacterium]MBU5293446.1 stage V sporulation protein T [Anaerosalibacter bizertensis]MCB5558885.1 stage V sporulation protein T [Anaerosalibacter bizertensis]MCG4565242.1 stage V sporulation protein T [Anaerosalibacter bizertensis]
MKATGIVRRIDDLGRVVIPKEIRRTLRIREGDPLEIFTDREGEVILKKYSPIGELNEFAAEYCESLYETTNHMVVITDRDSIIAVAGGSRKEYLEKRVSQSLEKMMESREVYISSDTNKPIRLFYEDESVEEYTGQIVVPIIMQGDPIGAIIFISKDDDVKMGEMEVKLGEVAAGFLSKQMES